MRVGIFDPYFDDLGGGEKYMMTIAECLSKDNVVDLFWDKDEDFKTLNQRFSLDLSKINLVKNIFSKDISTFNRILMSRKYDLLIVLSDGSIPLVLSKKLLIHIQQPLELESNGIFNKFKISRVDNFFTNSEYTKSFLNRFLNKIDVLYPPVEIKAKDSIKENIILHVGRFRPRNVLNQDFKKQSVMIKTFKEMVDKGLKDWKFVLAVSVNKEDFKDFESMKDTAKGYPIEFLINKSNDQLWDVYSKAKIYWHASGFGENLEKNPDLAEHFGISTVEAMGAGAVPVAINAGGQKEIVENKKNGFLWDNLKELKSITLELIEDPTLLRRVSSEAKKIDGRFSKEKFCEKINNIIYD